MKKIAGAIRECVQSNLSRWRMKQLFRVFLFLIVFVVSTFPRLVQAQSSTYFSEPEQDPLTSEQVSRVKSLAWKQAQFAAQNEDYDRAIWNLERILMFSPNDAEVKKEIQRFAMAKKGNFSSADEAAAMQEQPERKTLATRDDLQRIRMALDANDLKKAEALHQRLVNAYPDDPQLKSYEKEIQSKRFQLAIRQEKNSEQTRLKKEADQFYQKGLWALAVERYEALQGLGGLDSQSQQRLRMSKESASIDQQQMLDEANRVRQQQEQRHNQQKIKEKVEKEKREQERMKRHPKQMTSESSEDSLAWMYKDNVEARRAEELAMEKQMEEEARQRALLEKENTKQIETFIKNGKKLLNDGQYEEAIKVFEQVFALDPENREASEWIDQSKESLIAEAEKKYKENKKEIDKSVEEGKKESLDLAKALLEDGRIYEAQVEVERLLVIDPNLKEAKMLRVFIEDKIKELEMDQSQQALESSKNEYIRKSQVEFSKGNLAGAKVLMGKAVEIDPEDEKAKRSLAFLEQQAAEELSSWSEDASTFEKDDIQIQMSEIDEAKMAETAMLEAMRGVDGVGELSSSVETTEVDTMLQDLEIDYSAFLKEKARFQQERESRMAQFQQSAMKEAVMVNQSVEQQSEELDAFVEEAKEQRALNPVVDSRVSKETLVEMASGYFRAGNLKKAKETFEEIVRMDPDDQKAIRSIQIINERMLWGS